MTLLNRFFRLFRADVNAVFDSIEEPRLVLQQALRDMEASLASEQRHLAKLAAARNTLLARSDELEQTLTDCERDLGTCLAAGQDDLARNVLKRRLETEHRRKIFANKLQANQVATDAVTQKIAEWNLQLANIRQQTEMLANDTTSDCCRTRIDGMQTVSDEEVEIALLAEKERRCGI